jgi:hypothetical protein
MATKGSNQKSRTRSPMMHKSGKPRLGPLSLSQLEDMLAKSSRPKDKAKIENRVKILKKILHIGKVRVVETFKTE